MSDSKSSFRVIVVGAGVSGLAAAHALQKAGIDHVVLERRSVVAPPEGASIAMYPHGSRILHQFGCLDAVKSHCNPPGRWVARLPSGKAIANNGVFRVLEKNHGSGLLLIERRQFLQELYDTLPDKSTIKTGRAIKDIKQDDKGVEVILNDGEIERGDLVLGCDGVYSTVRSIMWDHANASTPGLISVKEKLTIRADWKCLVVMTNEVPELGRRDLTVVHNKDYSHMFTMTEKHGYFFVFFRLNKPCTWPNRPRYTDQDAQELADRIANHPISDTVVFGEVWKRRIRANVVNLEEGVLDHWFHGRIVLAGDSVHKVTPNMAFGGNSGIETVAVLVNHLRSMLLETNQSKPTADLLEQTLAAYQGERVDRMKQIMEFSGEITRVQAWHTAKDKFMANWLVPLLPDSFFGDQLGRLIAGAPKLDFVDAKDFPSGNMKWKDSINVASLQPQKKGYNPTSRLGWASAMAAFIMVVYVARFVPLAVAQS